MAKLVDVRSLLDDTIGECTVGYYTSLKCAYAEQFNSGMFFLVLSVNKF